ncbi:MAG: endonuclease/exonuclease/phosphatase family protein [Pseudomonadota bacterium]
MATLRIVSLNAWGGKLWGALKPWLQQLSADVLCLQEVTRAPEPSPAWLTYSDAERRLDQRADLLADVSECLPKHQAVFAPAARGPLSDRDGRTYLSEHGIAMWIAPDLALTAYRSLFVHGAYRQDGWGPEPVPRQMQVMRLAGRGAGGIVVGQLHGLRDPSGKGDTAARMDQSLAVRRATSQMLRPGEAAALVGDLNLLPGSESFEIWREIGLRDLIAEHGVTDTRTSHYTKSTRFADYALVNDATVVRAFDVPSQPEVSDHRPLILSVDI